MASIRGLWNFSLQVNGSSELVGVGGSKLTVQWVSRRGVEVGFVVWRDKERALSGIDHAVGQCA